MKDFKVEFLKLTEQLLKDSGQSPE